MGLSNSIRNLHREIIQGLNMVEIDMNQIKEDILAEETSGSTPFFL